MVIPHVKSTSVTETTVPLQTQLRDDRSMFPFRNLFITSAPSVRINYLDLDHFDISIYTTQGNI